MLIDIHTHQFTGRQIEVVSRTFGDDVENYFSVGIHPWDAERFESNIEEINKIALNSKCLAIGEVGLDKVKGPDLSIQKAIFIQQIAISEKLELPLILHCVRSWNEVKQLKQALQPKQTWIFHGFSKTSIVEEVIKAGFMISIGADVISNERLQEVIELIPLTNLFLETDNSPIPIEAVYQKVSEIKNIPLAILEKEIAQNFKRIFTKWTIG